MDNQIYLLFLFLLCNYSGIEHYTKTDSGGAYPHNLRCHRRRWNYIFRKSEKSLCYNGFDKDLLRSAQSQNLVILSFATSA